MKKTFIYSICTFSLMYGALSESLVDLSDTLRKLEKILMPCAQCSLDQLDIPCKEKESNQCFYKAEQKFVAHQPTIYKFCWEGTILVDTQGELHQFGIMSGKKDPEVKDQNYHPTIKVGGTPRAKGDVLIWNNGFEHWNWGADKTRHSPGITKKALEDLMSRTNKIDVIILTQGVQGVLKTDSADLDDYINSLKTQYPQLKEYELKTDQEVKDYLQEIHPSPQLDIIKLKTFNAVVLYNALVTQGKNVAMLLHSTC